MHQVVSYLVNGGSTYVDHCLTLIVTGMHYTTHIGGTEIP